MREGKVSWKEQTNSERVEGKKTECQSFQLNFNSAISLEMWVA